MQRDPVIQIPTIQQLAIRKDDGVHCRVLFGPGTHLFSPPSVNLLTWLHMR